MAPSHPPVPVVTLREPGDIVNAVPVLLGFEPADSLVAVALTGPRDRMAFTLRLDLLPPSHDEQVARMVAARMQTARAEAVVLFVYCTDPVTTDPDGQTQLPRRALVEALRRTLPMPVRDVLLVSDRRSWSYLCDDRRCCPAEGRTRTLDAPGTLALRAANALTGQAVLPSREAVVATVAPLAGVTAVSMGQAIQRAAAGRLTQRRAQFLAAARELLADTVARYAEPPAQLGHDEAARLVIASHDLELREDLLTLCRDDTDLARRLLQDLARLAPPPLDAPACTLLALSAYLQGAGVVTASALQRALGSDPDYTLARLLDEALHRQVSPARLRAILDPRRRRVGGSTPPPRRRRAG